jgi:hypothetical protein
MIIPSKIRIQNRERKRWTSFLNRQVTVSRFRMVTTLPVCNAALAAKTVLDKLLKNGWSCVKIFQRNAHKKTIVWP